MGALRLLPDACVPRKLKDALTPHATSTARERGWNRLPDGPLLDAMAGEIDVLITVDRSLPFQQRLHDRPFAVVVLRAKTNRLEDLLPLVPALLQVLNEVKPGEIREITE
jgi:predicted nuclease of predicted toxin-antitoxin system